MNKYAAQFYYEGQKSYKGLIKLDADNLSMAKRCISIMIESDSPELPQNWDFIMFTQLPDICN
jgi:hypothetical protein